MSEVALSNYLLKLNLTMPEIYSKNTSLEKPLYAVSQNYGRFITVLFTFHIPSMFSYLNVFVSP